MYHQQRCHASTLSVCFCVQAVVALREQYRMAADIMLLANTIVYDGQLRCGAQAVADASLDLQVVPSQVTQPAWLLKVTPAAAACVAAAAAVVLCNVDYTDRHKWLYGQMCLLF